jgi:glycogenin glucosyltransferase
LADHFNSGVFVYQPSKETFNNLISLALKSNSSFDGLFVCLFFSCLSSSFRVGIGGDQGFLNGFFSNWRTGDVSRHLPFKYNVNASAFCSFLPATAK